jgi:hypothetical protein
MKFKNSEKYTYYYLRYSLMLYPFVVLLAFLLFFVETPWDERISFAVLFSLFVPISISFFIFHGLIYEDGYKYAWHGFGKNQIHYNLFCGLTFGFGPWYVFFKRYDPILKEYFKENKK